MTFVLNASPRRAQSTPKNAVHMSSRQCPFRTVARAEATDGWVKDGWTCARAKARARARKDGWTCARGKARAKAQSTTAMLHSRRVGLALLKGAHSQQLGIRLIVAELACMDSEVMAHFARGKFLSQQPFQRSPLHMCTWKRRSSL